MGWLVPGWRSGVSVMRKRLSVVVIELLAAFIVATFSVPVYFLVINSFKSLAEVVSAPLSWPLRFSLDNYVRVIREANVARLFLNSTVVTATSLAGIVLAGSMAGFTISKMRFKNAVLLYFVLTLIIPFQAMMIPTVKLLKELGLMNSLAGLMLVYMGNGLGLAIFLYTGAASAIPQSLEESARIDGAGEATVFFKIVFPLMWPATKTIVILNGLWIWNDFLLPLIVVSDNAKKTLPLGTINLIMGQYSFAPNLAAAVSIISALPMVFLYVFMHRQIVQGIVEGAVRG